MATAPIGAAPVIATAAVVFLLMLAELWLSRANERRLRAEGAVEPEGDVYRMMAWAYPVCFAAMAIEGVWRAPAAGAVTVAGLAVFLCAKLLKYWAIASLGPRWSFRVLVLAGAPLVTHGPYAWMRHPNYVGVMGELAGMALLVSAPVSGVCSIVLFAVLLRRRIAVEEGALKRQSFTRSRR
jgi:methyltransferase